MYKIRPLQKGDTVKIVAPGSPCTKADLDSLINLLGEWDLVPSIPKDLFGEDLLCSNTDENRMRQFKSALYRDSKLIWCLRGGYGSAKILPTLMQLETPRQPKLVLGFSDITVLLLFLQHKWKWPAIHGPSGRQTGARELPEENIQLLKEILFGQRNSVDFAPLLPMNAAAEKQKKILSQVTGGNLCLVQTTIGTPWEINTRNKILLLEDVNERGYEIDRILGHLQNAELLDEVDAILFGDFLKGNEPDGTSLVEPVLQRFAENCDIPVLRYPGIGHGKVNLPVPFGTEAELILGSKPTLKVKVGFDER